MRRLVTAMAMIGCLVPAAAAAQGRDGWGGRDRYERRAERGWRDAGVRTFEAPLLGGLPLDICPRDVGVDGLLRGRCGIPVANEWCRSRGFADAADAPQVNAGGPTRFLSGDVVEHPWATTFRYITCER